MRYIKGSLGKGLVYENRGHTDIVAYTDADWAGSTSDRMSTSGYCILIGGISFLGGVRNEILWPGIVQRLNIDLCLLLRVGWFG